MAKDNDKRANDVAEQLEHAFMAGLGALSDAQKKGAKRFESLIKEGEKFQTPVKQLVVRFGRREVPQEDDDKDRIVN